jgi:hypothetical protein
MHLKSYLSLTNGAVYFPENVQEKNRHNGRRNRFGKFWRQHHR